MKEFGVLNKYFTSKDLYNGLNVIRNDTDAIVALIAKEQIDINSELLKRKLIERQPIDNENTRFCITQSGLDFMYSYETHEEKKTANKYLLMIAVPAAIYYVMEIFKSLWELYQFMCAHR